MVGDEFADAILLVAQLVRRGSYRFIVEKLQYSVLHSQRLSN